MIQFKKCYIEITNVCNLKCDFCPQSKRVQEFMSIKTYEDILDQVKNHTKYIYFHVKGEPLLHPEIDKFLDISYEKGFQVNITTNGTLINKVKDRLLAKPALRQMNFSLHSFDGNTGNKDKNEYMESILSFAKEARNQSELLIALRLWNLDENEADHVVDYEVDHIEEFKNMEILEIIERKFNLSYKIKEKVIPGRGVKIAEGIYLNHDKRFDWPDLEEKEDDGRGFCYGLRNQIAILVDGTVVPCCLDGEGIINLGNIHTTHFSDIIQTERAKSIVEGFSRREAVEELCRKCGYRKRFGR